MQQNPTLFEIEADVNEDGSFTLMGCLEARDGSGATQSSGMKLVQQADLSSITYTVKRRDTGATVVASTALTISSVIFDTLQTTWDRDTRGYNFRATLPVTACPDGNRKYQVLLTFTTTGGTVAFMRFNVHSRPTSSVS